MASPHAGSATHGQAVASASPQGRLVPLPGLAAHRGGACGHGRLRPTSRGGSRPRAHPFAALHPQRRPTAGHLQGAVGRRGGHLLAGWLPASKGRCRLCKCSSDGDADGARGVRASF
ncbi:hypothetical protein B296_00021760 [Ensete ventricosum]|uniref:Uncharacterized protein n=1 Tax=Ensete ventricosum TaxID=4639 RepID=A0A426YDY4_ENSVE|nr:hypothetical protein B296_00021760 [Ensete ventricosum]